MLADLVVGDAWLPRHPDMTAANRDAANLASRQEVQKFHAELQRKLALQREGRYRFLRWRKLTRELPRSLKKYVDRFLLRPLRT